MSAPEEAPQIVQPPSNIPAERAVLGAVISERAVEFVSQHLVPDDFYRPAHAAIYAAALSLMEEGTEVDPVTVMTELERRDELLRVGGAPFLHTLMSEALFAGSVGEHVRIVAEESHRRSLFMASQRLQQLALHRGSEFVDVLDRARATIDEAVAPRGQAGRVGCDLGDLLASRIDAYEEPVPPGIPFGWPDLDRDLGGGAGLQPGRMIIVAARPGVGKSVLGVAAAVSAARRDYRTLFVSLEMPRDEIADRIIADAAGVALDYLQAHNLDEYEKERVRGAQARLANVPMRIDDNAATSLGRVRAIARDMARQDPPLGMIVIDYLQLMMPADDKITRQEQVSAMSRGLKRLAKDFGVPVLVLAQLNRKVEERADKTPVLSDLRESGSLEQDADIVLMLARPLDRPGELDVHIAKNRGGPSGGQVALAYYPSLARVGSLTRQTEPYSRRDAS